MTVIPFPATPDAQHTAADPETSAFVTANAGSGKTTTLVARVARLLLRGVDPETVLCVTYTKAAAAEMQRRLFERLGSWAVLDDARLGRALSELEGSPGATYDAARLSAARVLFARALETPGGLKIQTIHAFCEKLLRRFPLEADVSPGFKVMDDAAAALIASEARDGVARRALAGEPVLAEAYARFATALDIDSFARMFRGFEDRREAIFRYVEQCGGLAGLPEALRRACGLERLEDPDLVEAAAVGPPALSIALWRAGAQALAASGERDRKCAMQMAEVAEAAAEGRASFSQALSVFCTGKGEAAKWPQTAAALKKDPALREKLLDERDRLMGVAEQARAQRVADDTLQALALGWSYAKAYTAAKDARGALDFADLIERTCDLLVRRADAAWVLYKLDGGLEHVLVDEAQDTAPAQWKIVRALTEEFFAGDDGRIRQLQRTVFVVGDEKQSIFSFQGAQPEQLMLEADHYHRLAKGAGRPFAAVPLRESWRSTPQVLAFVDAVFTPSDLGQALQPRAGARRGGEEALIKHIANRTADAGCIDLWPLERETDSEERRAWDEPLDIESRRGAYRRLADRIAGEVEALVARGERVHDKAAKGYRPAGYGDVLILVRKRGALFEELLRALKRRNLPVAGADRLVLSEHPVFEDLLALGRFALFPDDDLTLAGLLRSPLCDLDEASLFDLAHGRRGSLWAELKHRGAERPEWVGARELLGWARSEANARPPFDFFGRVLNRLDGDGRTMRQRFVTRLTGEAEDALQAFLAEALAAEGRGLHDLERFVDALARLDVTVKREMDEPRGEVRVMTAHGSKGLEAPIVFLPETVAAGSVRGAPLLETADGGFLWSTSEKTDCEASRQARAARKQKEADEDLRLLYVALTRARDRLVIAGRVNARANVDRLKGWWAPMCAAFEHEAIRDGVREVQVGDLTVRRFGPDPELGAAATAIRAAPSPLPGWSRHAPAAEPALSDYASPSTLADRKRGPAPSPLAAAADGLGRFRRGNLVHRLLQLLPDVAPAERPVAAERILAGERDLTIEQRAEMAHAALGLLADPRFAEVFGPGSRAEAAVAGTAPGLPAGLSISGRVDRMVVRPDRVLVVDFKTNRPSPDRVEDADPAYLAQMAVYTAVLRAVFPGRRVEAALVWTDGPKLMPVPEALISQTLARLT